MILAHPENDQIPYRLFSSYTPETLVPGYYWMANRKENPIVGDEQEQDKMIRVISPYIVYGAAGGGIQLKPTDRIAGPLPTPLR